MNPDRAAGDLALVPDALRVLRLPGRAASDLSPSLPLSPSSPLPLSLSPSLPPSTINPLNPQQDLGAMLAKCIYVFNCAPEMDYKSMGDIWKGLGASGAWGCFDEFNRLIAEVRTPHPEIRTPNQHSTLNTQHSTLNTQHSTLNNQHSPRRRCSRCARHSTRRSSTPSSARSPPSSSRVSEPYTLSTLNTKPHTPPPKL